MFANFLFMVKILALVSWLPIFWHADDPLATHNVFFWYSIGRQMRNKTLENISACQVNDMASMQSDQETTSRVATVQTNICYSLASVYMQSLFLVIHLTKTKLLSG